MSKTILITGSTDGIGLLTAKTLKAAGDTVLLHGRSQTKLDAAAAELGGGVQTYLADMSDMKDVSALGQSILADHKNLDVLINNAGIYKTTNPMVNGHDVRFLVNTLAPLLLTRLLLPIIPKDGRVINLSSAAQADVDPAAIAGTRTVGDFDAYAQSKLALIVWTEDLARSHPNGPIFVAVNPGSLLASKMVKEGFGVAGNDLSIGSDILCAAATDTAFATASGKYFDNDAGKFAPPHASIQNAAKSQEILQQIETTLASLMD